MARAPATPPAQPRRQSFQQRTHDDFGAINERLSGAERGIERLSADFANLSNSLSQQIGDLAKTFNENSRTNLLPLLSALVPAAAGVGALAWAFLAPVASQTSQNEQDMKVVLQTRWSRDDAEKQAKTIYESMNRRFTDLQTEIDKRATKEDESKDILRLEEVRNEAILRLEQVSKAQQDGINQKIDLYHNQAIVDLTRIDLEIRNIESNLVTRAEHTARDGEIRDRIDALSRNLEDTRKRLGDDFTLGDTIKSLERRIEKLAEESRNPIVAPIAPIGPLAPISPPKSSD